jgi:hypothetical protein
MSASERDAKMKAARCLRGAFQERDKARHDARDRQHSLEGDAGHGLALGGVLHQLRCVRGCGRCAV